MFESAAMSILTCTKCGGEGRRYNSYEFDTGQCEACEGSGHHLCEAKGCNEPATAFNDDGEALCQDCFFEWTTEAFET
jgi:hypothetical protein